MPGNVGRWGWDIDRVYNLSRVNVCDANLFLFLVVGACGNIAAVKGEVDRLDDATGQFQCPCAYPLLGVPERDEGITSARSQVFAAW
jgi:hypothetical protein